MAQRIEHAVTQERWKLFIDSLKASGSIRDAAARATPWSEDRDGARQSFVDAARRDPKRNAEMHAALDEALGRLEAVAFSHAEKGTQRPIYQSKELVGHETVFDHNLLLRVLSRLDPSWNEKKALDANLNVDSTAKVLTLSPTDVLLLNETEQKTFMSLLLEIDQKKKELDPPCST